MAGADQRQTVFDGVINLGQGREWHSTSLHLDVGKVVVIDAESPDTRFFVGLYSQANYDAAKRRSPTMFPFRLGSDQVAFHHAYNIILATDYRIVIRVSVFQRGGNISLRVQLV